MPASEQTDLTTASLQGSVAPWMQHSTCSPALDGTLDISISTSEAQDPSRLMRWEAKDVQRLARKPAVSDHSELAARANVQLSYATDWQASEAHQMDSALAMAAGCRMSWGSGEQRLFFLGGASTNATRAATGFQILQTHRQTSSHIRDMEFCSIGSSPTSYCHGGREVDTGLPSGLLKCVALEARSLELRHFNGYRLGRSAPAQGISGDVHGCALDGGAVMLPRLVPCRIAEAMAAPPGSAGCDVVLGGTGGIGLAYICWLTAQCGGGTPGMVLALGRSGRVQANTPQLRYVLDGTQPVVLARVDPSATADLEAVELLSGQASSACSSVA